MKRILIYAVLVFIVVIVVTLLFFVNKNSKTTNPTSSLLNEQLALLNNVDKEIDYFHYPYLSRYLSYMEKYPSLNKTDIVTRVNIGLDFPYYQGTKQSNSTNPITLLVNKYRYLTNDFVPSNLVEIDSKFTNSTRLLVYEAKENFEKMCSDALVAGYQIRAISAYRSYDYQKQLYDSYVDKDGEALADTYSARAGYSEHQTGLVVDVDNVTSGFESFEDTDEFTWMSNHAHEYGFILRYPKYKQNITGYDYEAWHYRYVGKSIATKIKELDITYDEYYIRFIENKKD